MRLTTHKQKFKAASGAMGGFSAHSLVSPVSTSDVALSVCGERPAVAYLITNKINGKKYVGVTTNLKNRLRQHRHSSSGCVALRSAIRIHGWKNFDVSILKHFPSFECAMLGEPDLIKQSNSIAPYGYNLSLGGTSTCGYKWSEASRANLSVVFKSLKKTRSQAQKEAASTWFKKFNKTQSHRLAVAKRMTGRTVSEQTKLKMSASKKGKVAYGVPVIINGVQYSNMKAAGDALGISKSLVFWRVKNKKKGYIKL